MKLNIILLCICVVIYHVNCSDEKPKYERKVPEGSTHFLETFESDEIGKVWIKSKAKKDGVEESIAKYDGEWAVETSSDSVLEGDLGLVLKSKAKHHAISSKLEKRFDFAEGKPLVVQYEVKFQNALDCGGAYVKLLEDESNLNLEQFFDKTSFSIMFGPDKCGTENKFHFIVRFKNPVTGKVEEHHAKKSDFPSTVFSDGKTHLYTLVLNPDNTFKMLIDNSEVNTGSLLNDLTPPINPPKEIVDVNDKKPESWDEREKIPDETAVKPEDWDENEPRMIPDSEAVKPENWDEDAPEMIPDPEAVKPDDWDEATDGEWEPPMIDNPKCSNGGCGKWSPPSIENPKYKGKWTPPLIDNPNYQGKWEPRKLPNPEYFEDKDPFRSLLPFSAVGLELWSMTENIYFDNFVIAQDPKLAELFAQDNWVVKSKLENEKADKKDENSAKEDDQDDEKDEDKDEPEEEVKDEL